MSNLRELPPPANDVREALAEALEHADEYRCIMIVGLRHDTSQSIRSSTMDGMEKQFLASFVSAWAAAWFQINPEET